MWLSFLVAGLVQRDEVDGDRWVLLLRVSTGPQLDGMSSDAQLSNLQQEVDEIEGEIVEEFEALFDGRLNTTSNVVRSFKSNLTDVEYDDLIPFVIK
jgi:hypothetical protein